jgi:predicted GIY-YIG superfamily endonuclease
MPYYVYLLASKRNGTLYLGVTSDIVRRGYLRQEAHPGMTGGEIYNASRALLTKAAGSLTDRDR